MATFFLILIYASFISLGLPDSVLGSAWPMMKIELHAPDDFAGYIFMVVAGGTIISSLFSSRFIKRFGTGVVTFVSVLMTATALFLFHFAPSYYWFLIFAIPLGLGAGAVDSGLNEFVAEHYESRHMSWLHSFWGLGAMTGPIIISKLFASGQTWRNGYLIISIIQFGLAAILFLSLPLWKKVKEREKIQQELNPPIESDLSQTKKSSGVSVLLKHPGVFPVLISIFLYCGVEQTMMLWGATYLIASRNVTPATAAAWISLFLAGITIGRFLSGFATFKLSNKMMIRLGELIILIGLTLLIFPLPSPFVQAGIFIAGLGCAPIYPCMLHETPVRFGKEHAQEIMGIQMAVAYLGSTLVPPTLGAIGTRTTMIMIPFVLFAFTGIMLFSCEEFNRIQVKIDSVMKSS
ncbi:MAG TPA: MFS transporter [Flexilinea sp.]|nr:MFS transporter [Flexilinea sp.]